MEPRQLVPVDNASANYREWVVQVQGHAYAIVEDMGQWTLMVNDPHRGWQDVEGASVDTFVTTHNLMLAEQAVPQERTHMETMIGYDFNADGKYDKRHYLKTDEQLGTFIRTTMVKAFMQGRAAMVTDSGDNAIFHIQGGKVLWAGGADIATFTTNLRALGVKQAALEASVTEALTRHQGRPGRDRGVER